MPTTLRSSAMSKTQRRWSPEEDAVLEREASRQMQKYDGTIKNWHEIAQKIPGRDNKDCRKRFYNEVTGGLRKGPWTKEEDELLIACVEQYGQTWATIAQKVKTRSADQCSKRWQHCLDPTLDRSSWTEEENRTLLMAVVTHGTSWKEIQECHFPGRAANNIKNQYTIIKRRSLSLPPDSPICCPDRSLRESYNLPVDLTLSNDFLDALGTDSAAMENLDFPGTEISSSHGTGNMVLDDGFLPSGSWYLPSLTDSSSDTPKTASSEDVVQFLLQNRSNDFEDLAARMDMGGGTDAPHILTPSSSSGFLGSSPVNDEGGTAMAETPPAPSSLQNMMRATLNMDNVSPETLSSVMELLIRSRAKVNLSIK